MKKSDVLMNGPEIVRRRLSKGLDQGALARKIGCCRRTVIRAESGTPVHLKTALEFAQAFRCELSELLLPEVAPDLPKSAYDHAASSALAVLSPLPRRELVVRHIKTRGELDALWRMDHESYGRV